MSWWLLLWFLLSAKASEMVLHYTTDLTDPPQIQIEFHGQTTVVEAVLLQRGDVFTEWQARWDSNGAWVQHLHIDHNSIDETRSTILMGPQQQGEIFLLNDDAKSRQQLLSSSGNINTIMQRESQAFQAHAWWLLLVVLCLWGVRQTSKVADVPKPTLWNNPWVTGLTFLMLSMIWQRSLWWTQGIPAKYHDALGTYWMLARSSSWDGLLDSFSMYPIGADYHSLDSFILWGTARLFAWAEPVWLYRSCLVFFPALSAWAADKWAREVGIKAPWSLITGILFGFSGLMDNAILEGQVYQCFTVGLPVTGIFVGRYLKSPTLMNWFGVMVGFALSLFSSSYLGASCLILLFGLWVGTGSWRRLTSLWVFLGVLPLLWLHRELMSTDGIHQIRELREMVIGSVSLMNFWGTTPEMDREGHAIALGASIVGLVLATQVSKNGVTKEIWRSLLCMGGFSMLLMIGPTLNLSHLDTVLSLPNTWLYQQPGFSSIGFPIRLAHPFLLSLAMFAGLAAQQMSTRHQWVWLILPLLWADVERRQLSQRQGFWSETGPAFTQIESTESIFALYPLAYKHLKGSDADIILYMLDCLAQVDHQKPIVNNCLSVNIHQSKVKDIQRSLLDRILNQGSIQDILVNNDLDALVVYPELFRLEDRLRVQAALEREMTLVETGQYPLLYQIYQAHGKVPQKMEQKNVSNVSIDLITNKDESKPLLVIGDGVLTETSTRVRAQTVVHHIDLPNISSSFALLIQNTDGTVLWEGTLYPNPEQDYFVIRPGLGPQMELPIFSSPPALSNERQWVWLLFGGLGLLFVFRRRHLKELTETEG